VVFVEEDLEVPLAPARALLVAVPHLVGSFANGKVLLWQRVKGFNSYHSMTVISSHMTHYTELSCEVAIVILLALMEHHVVPTFHGRKC